MSGPSFAQPFLVPAEVLRAVAAARTHPAAASLFEALASGLRPGTALAPEHELVVEWADTAERRAVARTFSWTERWSMVELVDGQEEVLRVLAWYPMVSETCEIVAAATPDAEGTATHGAIWPLVDRTLLAARVMANMAGPEARLHPVPSFASLLWSIRRDVVATNGEVESSLELI